MNSILFCSTCTMMVYLREYKHGKHAVMILVTVLGSVLMVSGGSEKSRLI